MSSPSAGNPHDDSRDSAAQRTNQQPKSHKATITEWIEAGCAVLLVFITGFYTYYASQQSRSAIKAANAAAENARIANETLIQIRQESVDPNSVSNREARAATSAADTAKDTLKASRQQFRNEQRPYVWANPGISTTNAAFVQITPLQEIRKTSNVFAVTVQAFNGGHSPAVRVVMTDPIVIFDQKDIAERKMRQYVPTYNRSKEFMIAHNTYVFMKTTNAMRFDDKLISDLSANSDKTMYILGSVEYTDMFAPKIAPYHLTYCYRLTSSGLPFSICGPTSMK